ncbi:alanyl-tRNA editing protein [Anaerosolibacter carboniphilus]|nr:DHHA1 domain-containing protein [Anaerosolibacter carboniphilus]
MNRIDYKKGLKTMTKKLYHENVYLKEFTADILSILEKEGKYHVILDQSAFYPEGGGQPHDQGWIEDSEVEYVYEENHQIYHVVNIPPEKLIHAKCKIDWKRRFDHMQQHLGQHILSSAFDKLFDAATVGFHLGTEYITIDITLGNITKQQIEKAEYLSNQVIWNNLHVKQLYPDPETLKALPLRKQPKVTENIRIVEIDQVDYSPCGGTHPSQTGEVGIIKIRRWEKIRDTTRIEFVCGNRALKDYTWKNDQINTLSNLFSVKDQDTQIAVEKMYSENQTMKKDLKSMHDQLMVYEAKALYDQAEVSKTVRIIHRVFEQRDFGELRQLAAKIVSNPNVVVLFGTKDNEKAQIVLSRSSEININMNELFKEISPLINGKGGGNPQTAQGGGNEVSNLGSSLLAAQNIIMKRYLA